MSNDVTIRLFVDDSQRVRFERFSREAEQHLLKVNNQYGRMLSAHQTFLNSVGGFAGNAALAGFGLLTAKVAGLSFAFRGLFKEFVQINEQFGDLDITLGSALKSMTAATKVTRELVSITAQSPIPLESLSRAVQSFSVIPQTSSLLRQQALNNTLSDPSGFLRKSLRTVEQMSVFRPDQGPEGAVFAIREALGGQMRSLIRRFDVPSRYLTQVSGKSTKELTENPEMLMKALSDMFGNIISPEAVVRFARQPKNLMANFREQLTTLPMYAIGHRDNNTGADPYGRFLMNAQQTFDRLSEFMKVDGPFEQKFTSRFRSALERLGETASDSATSLVDKLLDYMGVVGMGDRMERVAEGITVGFEKITSYAVELMNTLKESNVIVDFIDLMKKFIGTISTVVKGFHSFANTFGVLPTIIGALVAKNALPQIGTIFAGLANSAGRLVSSFRGVPAEALYGQFAGVAGNGTGSMGPGGIFTNGIGPSGIVSRKEAMLLQGKLARLAETSKTQMASPLWFGLDMMKGRFGKDELDAAFEQYRGYAAKDEYIRTAANTSHRLKNGGVSAAGLRYAFDRDLASLRYGGDMNDVFLAASASGMTSGQLVGASAKGVGNVRAPGMFRRMGGAMVGAMGGMLPGLAIGAGISLLTAGIAHLSEQMSFQTDALKANTSAIMSTVNQQWGNWEGSSTYRFRQMALGTGMDTKAGETSRKTAEDLINLVSSFGYRDKKGNIVSVDGSSSLMWDSTAVSNMKSQGAGTTAKQLAQLKAFGVQGLDPLIEKLTAAEATLAEAYSKPRSVSTMGFASAGPADAYALDRQLYNRTIDSVGESIASILGSPETIKLLQARIQSDQGTQIRSQQEASFASLSSRFSGIDPDLLRLIESRSISSTNWNEILANRMGAKSGGKSSMSDIISGAESLSEPFGMSAYTDVQASVTSMLDKEAPYTRQLQTFVRFQKKVAEAMQTSQNVLAEFDGQAGRMDADFTDLVKELDSLASSLTGDDADYVKELARTIRENSGKLMEGHLGAMKAQIIERTERLSNAVLETASGGAVGTLIDISSKSDSLNAGEMSAATQKLNTMLKAAGVSVEADFSNVLQRGQGTADEIAKSYETFYDHFGKVSAALSDSLTAQLSVLSQKAMAIAGAGGPNVEVELEKVQSESDKLTALITALQGATLENNNRIDSVYRSQLDQGLSSLRQKADTSNTLYSLQNPNASRTGVLNRNLDTNTLERELVAKSKIADKTKYITQLEEERKRILQEIQFIQEGTTFGGFFEGLTSGARTAVDELNNLREVGISIGESLKTNLGNAFGDFVTGAKSAGDAMRSFAVSVLEEAARIMANKAVASLMNGIFGSSGNSTQSGLIGLISTGIGAMFGSYGSTNTFQGSGFSGTSNAAALASADSFWSGMALGGPVRGGSGIHDDIPRLLMGGEFVMQKAAVNRYGVGFMHALNQGAISTFASGGYVDGGSPMQMIGGGGGTTNINITVNAAEGQVGGSNNDQVELAGQIEQAVLGVLARQSAPGGQVYNTVKSITGSK